MAKISLTLGVIVISFLSIFNPVEPSSAKQSTAKSFVEASCNTTLYPKTCLHYLSGFANSHSTTTESPHQLAQLAVSVSLSRARYTRSYLLKIVKNLEAMKSKDYNTVNNCLEQVNDTVEQLSQAIKELRGLGRQEDATVNDEMLFHISNVETWMSTALTDANSCLNQFPGKRMSKLNATIKGMVLNVAQLTSNALALFDRYASRYKAAADTQKP